MARNNDFDYEVINEMMGNLTFNSSAPANLQFRNRSGSQFQQQQPIMPRNPAMCDPFGDYFDDGICRGGMQPIGYMQRQAPVDGMEFSDYRTSIM